MPSEVIYAQTAVADGRKVFSKRARQGEYGACRKSKGSPRQYRPIASTATRCCHCSLSYLRFWHSPDGVLNLEGLKS